jgi:hypothetical protein
MASAKRHELPINFSVRNFKPGNARRRSTIRSCHAAGIEKQNATASFVTWNMCMTVQENIDIIRRSIRRNVLQPEFQPVSHNIADQWPLKIAVAISAHSDNGRSDRPQLVENRFRANIAKMPDFIGVFGHFLHAIGQSIVRVGKNEDTQNAFRFVHSFKRKFECVQALRQKAATLLKRDG